jgi:DNA-binding transcriptional MerR regulator
MSARYTVKQVAEMSGVSVRALHHYDEIGLLPPAEVGRNGYRYYRREQLLALQTILFYRELGFPLEQVRALMKSPTFDRLQALRDQRARVVAEARRFSQLLTTIDRTIADLEGKTTMNESTMYEGLENQERWEAELLERYGQGARGKIEESRKKLGALSPAETAALKEEMRAINAALAAAMDRGALTGSPEVQALTARHHAWVSRAWVPDARAYAGLGQLYVESEELRQVYDDERAGLAAFLAEAMRYYAEETLSREERG